MALGPGKYDGLCTLVREQAKARGAAIIVWDGGGVSGRGAGFSVQADPEILMTLPNVLRAMADTMEGHQQDVHSPEGNN